MFHYLNELVFGSSKNVYTQSRPSSLRRFVFVYFVFVLYYGYGVLFFVSTALQLELGMDTCRVNYST